MHSMQDNHMHEKQRETHLLSSALLHVQVFRLLRALYLADL